MSGNNNNNTQPSDFDLQAALDASHALSQAVDSSASAPVNTETVSQPTDASDYDLDAAMKASEESFRIERLREYMPQIAIHNSPLREWTGEDEPVLIKCCICTYDVPSNTLKYFVCGHGMCKMDCLPGFTGNRCPECRSRLDIDFTMQAMVLSTNFYLEEQAKKAKEREFLEEALGSHLSGPETFESDDESDSEVVYSKTSTKRTIETVEEVTVFKANKKPFNVRNYSKSTDQKSSANDKVQSTINENSHNSSRFVAAPAPTIFEPLPLDANDPFAALLAVPTIIPAALNAVAQPPVLIQPSGLDEELEPEPRTSYPEEEENEYDLYIRGSILERILAERENNNNNSER